MLHCVCDIPFSLFGIFDAHCVKFVMLEALEMKRGPMLPFCYLFIFGFLDNELESSIGWNL